ncbi:FMN-dependent NADH-azoreductase 2 [Mesoplasma sp. JKS002658]|uniref:FMN-dependent NADH-azoreductase n=1 Tax=Mesoplasma whartonense TaxID=2878854 RepID=UPI002022AFEC|nr:MULTISPECIES: FMN-dependent NADH-azoreductase [unclassified Mesoplasma]MCL8211596.1 FMN-dependent NADH-azoreductase 2 [Mesoplasma sp. JKS002664]MCL8212335.1 FMN-dependent NADH-azoreductase 2 [Mesoplasma sp. JKS002662]MCL8212825.1 FMN-dependent NADH-azoreductase 2 [Mesoplasma sp. JKS002661]MCL8214420.1 FMN-dependent NADH-azoreductase 2 [Mesoplasma sp. JKS002658]MCL8215001.1 FMN-dependent NADH-azoreductase 2 [Mesoplasma sp. JKS002663]
MSKVLVISTSVSAKEKSYSLALLDRFLKHYQAKNPSDEIIKLDLNQVSIAQKTLNVENQATFWDEETKEYINQLKTVDKLVIASPMHNFNIPAMMKNYLDHVLLANETFSYKYSEKGDAKGLLPDLTVQILTTQGAPYGWYRWGNHTDYLWGTWDFVGAKVKEPILVAGTKTKPYSQLEPSKVIDEFDARIKVAAEEF